MQDFWKMWPQDECLAATLFSTETRVGGANLEVGTVSRLPCVLGRTALQNKQPNKRQGALQACFRFSFFAALQNVHDVREIKKKT